MAANFNAALDDSPQGMHAWMRALYNVCGSRGGVMQAAVDQLQGALAAADPVLHPWMRSVTRNTVTALAYDLCKATEGSIAASSPFGVWMREMSICLRD